MNMKKNNIIQIQNKFYESLRQKEAFYKEWEEKNKNNKDEDSNINLEFNYPYFIYQEIKKKEKEDKKSFPQSQSSEDQDNIDSYKKNKKSLIKANKNVHLIKTNVKYNILYEY